MTKQIVKEDVHNAIRSILASHPGLKLMENGRIKCAITDHEMVCRKEAILQHINGKKYQRMTNDLHQSFTCTQLEPHLVPSIKKGHEHQLFCTLTLKHVNKIPQHIERHMKGRKFLRAKIRWEECQTTGATFQPTPLMNRHKNFDIKKGDKLKKMKQQTSEDEVSDADSFSDLYPEKYFERLSLDSKEKDIEKKLTKKCKSKRKTNNNNSSSRVHKRLNVKKRKLSLKDGVMPKKKCLNQLKSKKSSILLG